MRFIPRLQAVLAAVLVSVAVSADVATAQENPVVKQMEVFRDAFNAGDAETLARVYHPDAALLPPGSKAVMGRDEIQQNFAKAFASGVSKVDMRIVELELVGPASAYEIVETRIEMPNQILYGRTIYLWTNVDGNWLIMRDMYHILGTEPKEETAAPAE